MELVVLAHKQTLAKGFKLQRGIILLEAISAIVLCSGLLLLIMLWQQQYHEQVKREQQLSYIRQLMIVVQDFYQYECRLPVGFAELIEKGFWSAELVDGTQSKWGWRLERNYVVLLGSIYPQNKAAWLATRLPNVRVENGGILLIPLGSIQRLGVASGCT